MPSNTAWADGVDGEPDLDAGAFSSWVAEVQAAIRGEGEADVPCAGCTACCTSSQFVHIAPDETDTLAHVPAALLFPAPRLPRGHVLMGYDQRGHCPMLGGSGCSIYEHRPRTCRTYDCRVFPAAGLEVDGPDIDEEDKVQIARRARRWRFSYPSQDDPIVHEAVRAAARSLADARYLLADEDVPRNVTQCAVLAIEIHEAFLGRDEDGQRTVVEPSPDVVRVELRRRR